MLLSTIAICCKALVTKEGRTGSGYAGIPATAKFRRSAMEPGTYIKYTDHLTYPHLFRCDGHDADIMIWTAGIADLIATDWEFIE